MVVLCDAAAGASARAADGGATSGAVSIASAGVGADGAGVAAGCRPRSASKPKS